LYIKDNYTIVAYGDSITKGIVYDNEKSKYSIIKDNFTNIISSSIKGSVYNVGKFGSTIIRGINKMNNDVIKKAPDIVLIEFGGNDCDFKWDDIGKNPDLEYQPNTDINVFKETLLKMIDTLKNDKIFPALMTLPPLDPFKYFNWIGKGDASAEKNILHWLGSKERLFTWHDSYNNMIAEVAKESRTVLIDIRSEFLKCDNYSDYLCIDGIHPNDKGQSLIASSLLDFIKNHYKFLLQS
jgi:lysophospholipase L1-like esterase